MSNTAFDKCSSYFQSNKGLGNDFTFPGALLEALTLEDRVIIEEKIVNACLMQDSRFFDALGFCDPGVLTQRFTGSSMQNLSDIDKRSALLGVLYARTHLPDYLLNLIRIAPESSLALHEVNKLLDADPTEGAKWLSDEYRLICRAYKTMMTVKTTVGRQGQNCLIKNLPHKKSDYNKIIMLGQPEISQLTALNDWVFENCEDHLWFYHGLTWRNEYVESHDYRTLNRLSETALQHPEVYDVLDYMIKTGELSKDTLSQAVSQKHKKLLSSPSDLLTVIQDTRPDISYLRKLMLAAALTSYSPDTRQHLFMPAIKDLCILEWGTADVFSKYVGSWIDEKHSDLLDIKDCDSWDYNQSLAFLYYLQRLSRWDDEDYFLRYCSDGTIRKILLRMLSLS